MTRVELYLDNMITLEMPAAQWIKMLPLSILVSTRLKNASKKVVIS